MRTISSNVFAVSSSDSFFGNVCYSPRALSAAQRAPHIDGGTPGSVRREIKLALVHYISPAWQPARARLSKEPEGVDIAVGGGTAFYLDRHSNHSRFAPEDCGFILRHAEAIDGSQRSHAASSIFCQHGHAFNCSRQWPPPPDCKGVMTSLAGRRPAYMASSDSDFELLLHVPYRFDTAVIYEPSLLHSAFIDGSALEGLSCDAGSGRLTANLFIV
eukprot:CAMPEP_0179205190 /NCGR_PEP_ID=MMETSP0796-20121207/102293_1 /TAXON_ID=73915 /ORGANISM="Pyrodinium bahamense, Strain pbaha01" /LENGTH=215 /DNA_ID=CAMNT_0020910075 /DNA_START=81 /DNA_END=728 /DNA_ORIENTATION=-